MGPVQVQLYSRGTEQQQLRCPRWVGSCCAFRWMIWEQCDEKVVKWSVSPETEQQQEHRKAKRRWSKGERPKAP
jgi:hypothetical protein